MRGTTSWIALLATVVLAGCSDPAGVEPGPPRTGVLQLVGYNGQYIVHRDESVRWSVGLEGNVLTPPRLLDAPDTVAAGATFEITVTTIGLNGCWASAEQDLRAGAGVVELTPTDTHSGAAVCTEVLQYLPHRSALVVATPGAWLVRVRGRRVRVGDASWEEPVVAEKTVVVR